MVARILIQSCVRQSPQSCR